MTEFGETACGGAGLDDEEWDDAAFDDAESDDETWDDAELDDEMWGEAAFDVVAPWNARPVEKDAPVFTVDSAATTDYPNGDSLPAVRIYERLLDENGRDAGRVFAMDYPFYPDEDGNDALYYGGGYYEEGMSYTDPADHDRRVACFQAAELLYRHAAGRNNAVANLCLGYVYSYDRCEGRYWRGGQAAQGEGGGAQQPYPREERAFECLKAAAEAGIPEACYKLGDMYKHGTGCTPDAVAAFGAYVRASEFAEKERPVVLGSIALRLGGCYEEGFGCTQDFTRAASWYEEAAAGLEFAVEHGEAWYEKALAGAQAGLRRCRQELAG